MVQGVLAALRRLDDDRLGCAALCTLSGGLAVGSPRLVVGDSVNLLGANRLGSALACGVVVRQLLAEGVLGLGQQDAVLRALRAGDGRDDGGQVQLEVLGVLGLLCVLLQPHALCLGVRLDAVDVLLGAAGQVQVVDGLLVDREDRTGGAELRGHVADGGAVCQRDFLDAVAVELDELLHHAVLAQHLGDGEHDVGCGHAGRNFAGELEAHDARDEHGDRLAQHCSLSLDAAHTPAQDAQAVFHGGVGVGADAGVRVSQALVVENNAGEVLDVDLVDNAGSRRHDAEVGEVFRTPAQELVALLVALVLNLDVLVDGVLGAECFDDHGVVDDHLGRVQRVDLVRVAAEGAHGLTHGCKVDHARHAGEVLHEDAGRGELNFHARLCRGVPVRDGLDVVLGDVLAVLGAQEVLAQHLEGVGEFLHAFDGVECEVVVGLSADLERLFGTERVLAFCHGELQFSSYQIRG